MDASPSFLNDHFFSSLLSHGCTQAKVGKFSLTKNLDLPQFSVSMDDPSQEKCNLNYTIGEFLIKIERERENFLFTHPFPLFSREQDLSTV